MKRPVCLVVGCPFWKLAESGLCVGHHSDYRQALKREFALSIQEWIRRRSS